MNFKEDDSQNERELEVRVRFKGSKVGRSAVWEWGVYEKGVASTPLQRGTTIGAEQKAWAAGNGLASV